MRAAFDAPVTLRVATANDARFVSELATRAFGEYDPRAASTTRAMMNRGGARTLLAARAERPIGFAITQPETGAILALNAIAVLESERGRGVGKRLLQTIERDA